MSMPAEHLTSVKTLDRLLDGYTAAPEIAVAGIASDSREIGQGDVFFATRGMTHHGLEFARRAVDSGARAVVYDPADSVSPPNDLDVPVIALEGLGDALGTIASRFFDDAAADVSVLGVTGTNGKTTVAWLLAGALRRIGRTSAYSGTLGHGIDDVVATDTMTSPDVIELHRRLAAFRDAGATHAAIEVSSHALDQGRVDGVRFDTVLFTNLSRDHLDYHGSLEAYADTKATLFTDYPATRRVVSLDSEFGAELASRCGDDVITVSTRPDSAMHDAASIALTATADGAGGFAIELRSVFGNAGFVLPLPGDYNVSNAGLVIACLCGMGVSLDDAVAAMVAAEAPPGRMQRVPATADAPAVFVDYAHTPDALEAALTALKPHTAGRLWCVFGCGGDRDAGKRPLMGAVAERLADRVILTDDNPRNESPGDIVDDILAGLKRRDDAMIVGDRAAAIAAGIARAAADDVVLIAGKGHEDYQIVGTERLDFSDYLVALVALDQRGQTEAT